MTMDEQNETTYDDYYEHDVSGLLEERRSKCN